MDKLNEVNRRSFLRAVGSAGMVGFLPEASFGPPGLEGQVAYEVAEPAQGETGCGMSHDHIYGMIGAVQRGGGVWSRPGAAKTTSSRRSRSVSRTSRSSLRRTRFSTIPRQAGPQL
jgi:hypothetical protein